MEEGLRGDGESGRGGCGRPVSGVDLRQWGVTARGPSAGRPSTRVTGGLKGGRAHPQAARVPSRLGLRPPARPPFPRSEPLPAGPEPRHLRHGSVLARRPHALEPQQNIPRALAALGVRMRLCDERHPVHKRLAVLPFHQPARDRVLKRKDGGRHHVLQVELLQLLLCVGRGGRCGLRHRGACA